MVLINKGGDFLANKSQTVKSFETEEEFKTWRAALPSPKDIDSYAIIKAYDSLADNLGLVACLIDGETFYVTKKINYFTVESDTPMTVTPRWSNSGVIDYSIDNGLTWIAAATGIATQSAKKFLFKGNMATNTLHTGLAANNNWTFTDATNVRLSGDLTTLLKPNGAVDELAEYAFAGVFSKSVEIVDANSLKLPSTKLSKNCYQAMFLRCSSLMAPPALPALVMTENCYNSMFNGCSALTIAPKLPSVVLAPYCYQNLLSQTAIRVAPELPATTLTNYCYMNMFALCTNLTDPPELPATTLADSCYYGMFMNSSNMHYVPKLDSNLINNITSTYMFYRSYLFAKVQDEEFTYPVTNNGDQPINNFSALGALQPGETIYAKVK